MPFAISVIKNHLIGLGHGGTLKRVKNEMELFQRVGATFLLKLHPLESMIKVPLTDTVHDDIYDYAIPYNFGSLIDLMPQSERTNWDKAFRNPAGQFDLEKAIRSKTVSIEGNAGEKILRINWRSRGNKVLSTMDSYDGNGTWSATAGASGVVTDTITRYSGSGSVRFNITATGGGIQNTTMTQVDLTDENGVADNYVAFYLGSDYANLTSIQAVFGNDLTTKYWTTVAVTAQADGRAFQQGWNVIKKPWSTATQSGTVAPATIDSYKLIFNTTGVLANVRVDNILFSIGRAFDIKFYSQYLYKSNTTGLYISIPATDDDLVMIGLDTLPHFLMECLKAMAQQMEGTDAVFDITYAENELKTLFPAYRGLYPSQNQKSVGRSGPLPRVNRRY